MTLVFEEARISDILSWSVVHFVLATTLSEGLRVNMFMVSGTA